MLEAHGGYLLRIDDLDVSQLVSLAREALARDGESARDCSLMVSVLRRPRVVRLAYDAPHTYGRRGARWYLKHHALARLVSLRYGVTVHTYVLDPEELEGVASFAQGQPVGGELLRYEDADLPDAEVDEASFKKLRSRWPLGHLGRVLGVERDQLLRIARAPTVLFDLIGEPRRGGLSSYFPSERTHPPGRGRTAAALLGSPSATLDEG